ncbi:hypothetical protein [Leadbetterella byssophila]|uniref:hypothetical protein n=1 Tax=Leadbetterella byssophila TaxID=316068 RepID=UPI0039A1F05D
MKKAVYLLLLLFTISACSKDKDPKPADNVKGNWALQTGEVKMNIVGSDSTNALDFSAGGIYIQIKENGEFESNLAIDMDSEGFFGKTSIYQSTYTLEGDYIEFKIAATNVANKIPIKVKIIDARNNELHLKMSKPEILEALYSLSQYVELADDLFIVSLFTSLEIILNFTK